MSGHVRWADIRAAQVERAGGDEAGKQELLAEVIGQRLAEVRKAGRSCRVGGQTLTPIRRHPTQQRGD